MTDVIRTYSMKAVLLVETGSSVASQEVKAEGATVAEAFDTALKAFAELIRPGLVAQDEMRARARAARDEEIG